VKRVGFFLPTAIALVFLALFVRERPVWRTGDRFAVPVDFDEGVNYATAVLSAAGRQPYRDFDFAHPPGVTLIASGFERFASPGSVSARFANARIAMGAVGALSVALLLAIGWRAGVPWAGCLAGLLYATYPEAISAERGVFLEPLVNVFALAAIWLVAPRGVPWRHILAGVCLALAIAVKLTAVVWVPGIALLAYSQSRFISWRYLCIGLAIGALAFFGPSVWSDPSGFFEDVVWFQMARPPDGDAGLGLRLSWIFSWPHLAMNVFAGLSLIGFSTVPREQRRMFVAAALTLGLTLAALLLSKGYWRQYNAQLAGPAALVAGLGVFSIARLIASSKTMMVFTRTAMVLLLLLALRSAYRSGRGQASPEQAELVDAVARNVPRDSCFVIFEPAWAIMADRFPPSCANSRAMIDPYLVMLVDAMRTGERFATPADAFVKDASQVTIRKTLDAADVVVVDARGKGQLNQATLEMLKNSRRLLQESPGADFFGAPVRGPG
jgi:hypothetical protein